MCMLFFYFHFYFYFNIFLIYCIFHYHLYILYPCISISPLLPATSSHNQHTVVQVHELFFCFAQFLNPTNFLHPELQTRTILKGKRRLTSQVIQRSLQLPPHFQWVSRNHLDLNVRWWLVRACANMNIVYTKI